MKMEKYRKMMNNEKKQRCEDSGLIPLDLVSYERPTLHVTVVALEESFLNASFSPKVQTKMDYYEYDDVVINDDIQLY